eukprot:1378306-Amorphochlora_amoeboformis.AAC.1
MGVYAGQGAFVRAGTYPFGARGQFRAVSSDVSVFAAVGAVHRVAFGIAHGTRQNELGAVM